MRLAQYINHDIVAHVDAIKKSLESVARAAPWVNATLEFPHPWTPKLWPAFLNADVDNPASLWPICRDVCRAMILVGDRLDEAGIKYNDGLRRMKIPLRKHFVERYRHPASSARDHASRLQSGMRNAVSKGKGDMIAGLGEIRGSKQSLLRGSQVSQWTTRAEVIKPAIMGMGEPIVRVNCSWG